jgi:DNA-damage-inducible protein D
MTELTLFHFDDDHRSFEDLAVKNGANLWEQADLMAALDYQSHDAFRSVMLKAMQACLSLGIATEDNFVRQADQTYRFTRFACYLIAMNGDPKKTQVAAAQVYFAALAETFQSALEHADAIDRVLVRDEVADGEKSLSSTAKRHSVTNYAFFQNAGYRGMYNMNLNRLRNHKGLSEGENLIDRMGKAELAAHLFRITQTDEKIKKDGIQGQRLLEDAALRVGKQVRKSMLEISGRKPEDLPPAEHLKDVKKRLKATDKQLRTLDVRKSED